MILRYDRLEDAIYIEFVKGNCSRTRKVSDSIMLDEDAKGKVLGIEILDASDNIPAFDPSQKEILMQTS